MLDFKLLNSQAFLNGEVIFREFLMSSELIQKESLLCKLLALKANDTDTDPEELVREIYQTVSQMKDQLPRDILLLIEQNVSFYKKISQEIFERIKKEVRMDDYPETISVLYSGR